MAKVPKEDRAIFMAWAPIVSHLNPTGFYDLLGATFQKSLKKRCYSYGAALTVLYSNL